MNSAVQKVAVVVEYPQIFNVGFDVWLRVSVVVRGFIYYYIGRITLFSYGLALALVLNVLNTFFILFKDKGALL